MKNKVFSAFMVIILCFMLMICAFAVNGDESTGFVADNADVLTDSEEKALAERLENVGFSHGIKIGVLTVDSTNGKSLGAFADAYYDFGGYGYGENSDGLMLLYNTGRLDNNRGVHITARGKAIKLMSDAEMDEIIDLIIPWLQSGQAAVAFDTFADESMIALENKIPLYWIPLSIAIGFVLAFIVVKIEASKLNSIRQQIDAAAYVEDVMLTGEADRFMFKNVKRIPKPKNTSGSSTHRSSSGHTHSGRGRNF